MGIADSILFWMWLEIIGICWGIILGHLIFWLGVFLSNKYWDIRNWFRFYMIRKRFERGDLTELEMILARRITNASIRLRNTGITTDELASGMVAFAKHLATNPLLSGGNSRKKCLIHDNGLLPSR